MITHYSINLFKMNSLKNSFKSLLYKQKYCAINYKLSFIFNLDYKINSNKYIYKISYDRYSNDKFNFSFTQHRYYNNIEYRYFNKAHKLDGPAFLKYENKRLIYQAYCINGEYHREDGPAIIFYNAYDQKEEKYYQHNKLHRELSEGPAHIIYERTKKIKKAFYYFDNKEFVKCNNFEVRYTYNKDGNVKDTFVHRS